MIGVMYYYLLYTSETLSCIQLAMTLIDTTLLIYGYWNGIRMTIYFVMIMTQLSVSNSMSIDYFNKQLWKQIESYLRTEQYYHNQQQLSSSSSSSLSSSYSSSFITLIQNIYSFCRKNHDIYKFTEKFNNHLMSQLWMIALSTHLIMNVFILSMLMFRKLSFVESLVLSLIMSFENVFSSFSCAILINWSNSLHRSGKLYLQCQLALRSIINDDSGGGSKFFPLCMQTKLKLMIYYELNHTRRPFYFRIGSLGKISKKSMYKV